MSPQVTKLSPSSADLQAPNTDRESLLRQQAKPPTACTDVEAEQLTLSSSQIREFRRELRQLLKRDETITGDFRALSGISFKDYVKGERQGINNSFVSAYDKHASVFQALGEVVELRLDREEANDMLIMLARVEERISNNSTSNQDRESILDFKQWMSAANRAQSIMASDIIHIGHSMGLDRFEKLEKRYQKQPGVSDVHEEKLGAPILLSTREIRTEKGSPSPHSQTHTPLSKKQAPTEQPIYLTERTIRTLRNEIRDLLRTEESLNGQFKAVSGIAFSDYLNGERGGLKKDLEASIGRHPSVFTALPQIIEDRLDREEVTDELKLLAEVETHITHSSANERDRDDLLEIRNWMTKAKILQRGRASSLDHVQQMIRSDEFEKELNKSYEP